MIETLATRFGPIKFSPDPKSSPGTLAWQRAFVVRNHEQAEEIKRGLRRRPRRRRPMEEGSV